MSQAPFRKALDQSGDDLPPAQPQRQTLQGTRTKYRSKFFQFSAKKKKSEKLKKFFDARCFVRGGRVCEAVGPGADWESDGLRGYGPCLERSFFGQTLKFSKIGSITWICEIHFAPGSRRRDLGALGGSILEG